MYGEQYDVKCNSAKIVIMICRTKEDKYMAFPDFKPAGNVLNICSVVKYLGHELTDDEDIYRQCRMLYVQALYCHVNSVVALME